MNKPLYDFFTADHRRIEQILEKAIEQKDYINDTLYQQFRTGLLTHIKMEEKILFPAAQKANGGEPIPMAAKLRLDHGAITALMVPTPTVALIKVLKYVLDVHDEIEEKPGGMYDICENLTHLQTKEILDELAQVTPVPIHPHNDIPLAMQAAKRALTRAGFDYDEIAMQ